MKKDLTPDEINTLRTRRDQVRQMYGARNDLFTRYENIYFMKGTEKPKDPSIDDNDWKVTVSPTGRDKVTGLKRILDTAEIQIKVKERGKDSPKSDKIEAALKTMLRVSGEYRRARPEKDTNLASVLYGPVVLTTNCVDDLIKVQSGKTDGVAKYIKRQLETIKKRTPFLIDTMNPKESYPEWGKFGMTGHLQEYTMKGSEIKEQWGVSGFDDDKDYTVQDFFHYDMRLVEADKKTLFSGYWMAYTESGDAVGVSNIPVFVRYAGGSDLFSKPEEGLQSFLYAYAKGEWHERETLFWTYVFTAIFMQGIPGPVVLQDPEKQNEEISVNYTGGVKVITASGKLENINVIDSDVLQLKNLMDKQSGTSTIQDQTIGGPNENTTFSGYVTSLNAGKLPAVDAMEAQEQGYRDVFLHILQRIKAENIENDLISADDIPDDVDLEVTLEPDLQQDDLRNAQIVTQLKNSDATISDEWLHTNLLKIADSKAMFKQVSKERLRKAVMKMLESPEALAPFVQAILGQKKPTTPPQTTPQPAMPTGDPSIPLGQGDPSMMGMGEVMPKTDAMIPMQERQ